MICSLNTTLRLLQSRVLVLYNVGSILAVLMLSACSTTSPLVVDVVPLELETPDRPTLPLPQPITPSDQEWLVLTPETVPEDGQWVYFGVTPQDYEKLSLTMAEIRRWVETAYWQLRYYRGEVDGSPQP